MSVLLGIQFGLVARIAARLYWLGWLGFRLDSKLGSALLCMSPRLVFHLASLSMIADKYPSPV